MENRKANSLSNFRFLCLQMVPVSIGHEHTARPSVEPSKRAHCAKHSRGAHQRYAVISAKSVVKSGMVHNNRAESSERSNTLPVGLKVYFTFRKGALKTYSTQPTLKESARAVRSARSASHLERGLFLAIFLPGIDFVVVQHLVICLYHKLEKRQQPIVRLIGRSTSLVFGIISLDFLAVQVSVQFCIRSSSSYSSSWWLINVRLACRQ